MYIPISYTGTRDPRVTVIKLAFRLPAAGDAKLVIIMLSMPPSRATKQFSFKNNYLFMVINYVCSICLYET